MLARTAPQRHEPSELADTIILVELRGRGRQAKIIVSASSDGSWRWGSVRANIQPDGMR